MNIVHSIFLELCHLKVENLIFCPNFRIWPKLMMNDHLFFFFLYPELTSRRLFWVYDSWQTCLSSWADQLGHIECFQLWDWEVKALLSDLGSPETQRGHDLCFHRESWSCDKVVSVEDWIYSDGNSIFHNSTQMYFENIPTSGQKWITHPGQLHNLRSHRTITMNFLNFESCIISESGFKDTVVK